MLSFAIQGLLVCVVACYTVYVLLELRMVRLSGKKQEQPAPVLPINPEFLPRVSVLLPVYNEAQVVERLIDAVCALNYPPHLLEILVLDDSSDSTTTLAKERIALRAAEGHLIKHLRREKRVGYKAGNLNFGLEFATGDFLAIFDADAIPPNNFLEKTIPCFQDERVGFLQTAKTFINSNACFLTRFQALEAGHQQFVTAGLNQAGLMASLTGSSCVWRKACLESVGGISSATITEDVDLGYRAQFERWNYVFLNNVASGEELPESISAFRVQRERWARGLVQNALRHIRGMFAASMSAEQKLHAIFLMFSSLLLASFYVVLLLTLPVALLTPYLGAGFNVICLVFLLATIVWASSNCVGGKNGASLPSREPLWRQAARTCAYVAMFLPMSLYYFFAAIRVFSGRGEGFHRTPKGSGQASGKAKKRIARTARGVNGMLQRLERFSLVYALAALIAAIIMGNGWVILFSLIASSGFAIAIYFSWQEVRHLRQLNFSKPLFRGRVSRGEWRHVLITGATGSIGRAVALEYARPGRLLTLHGRNVQALEEVAGLCRSQGAEVALLTHDLRQRAEWRAALEEVCSRNAPDLVIANAGLNTNIGPQALGEKPEEAEALVEVNLLGVINTVTVVLPFMRGNKQSRIALVSSLAGYCGLPATPTYCATKAAIRIYGDSLRLWLKREGPQVSVITPGYVDSPMCRAMPGPKPFLWSPAKAAKTIRQGLDKGKSVIAFPIILTLGIRSLALLPGFLRAVVLRWCGYGY